MRERSVFGRGATASRTLLQEQFEAKLVALRGGESSIEELVEPNEEAAGVRAEEGAERRTGEPADERANQEWANRRLRRHRGRMPSRRFHDERIAP